MLEMWETSLPGTTERVFHMLPFFSPSIFDGAAKMDSPEGSFLDSLDWSRAGLAVKSRNQETGQTKLCLLSRKPTGVKGHAVIESEGRGIWESLQEVKETCHQEKFYESFWKGSCSIVHSIVLVCCVWVTRGELGYLDGNRSHDVESYARALCTMLTFCWCARGPVRVPCTVRGRGFCLVKGVMVLHLCYSF